MIRSCVCALLLSLISASPDAHAKCAMTGLSPEVKTAHDATLPADGAIVVAATSEPNGATDPGDVAEQKEWKLRVGKAEHAPVIELVAPGLALYRWPASATATTTIELADRSGNVLRTTKLDPAHEVAKLRAPNVKRVTWSQRRSGGRGTITKVVAELAGKPPAGAIALVITDARGTALSWGEPDQTSTVGVFAPARCETLPNGTVEPAPRQRVKLFWVDRVGRKSPPSRTFVVGK